MYMYIEVYNQGREIDKVKINACIFKLQRMHKTGAILYLISNIHFKFIDISRTSLMMDDLIFMICDG